MLSPLVAVALGLSGAGLATTFEPLRPCFMVGTVLALGSGFVALHREERRACTLGALCALPVACRRIELTLWLATALAVLFVSFPWWSSAVFQ
jgi:mercuric ion transport protein